MRDPNRIYKFCNQLAEIWVTKCPDWRFGQLVLNVLQSNEVDKHIPFYIEDNEMMEHIKKYFKMEVDDMKKYWIQVWYSWGDQEAAIAVPVNTDPWEYMKKLAVDEAEIEYITHGVGMSGLMFFPDELRIILHYPSDDTYCYYQITEKEEFDPEQD